MTTVPAAPRRSLADAAREVWPAHRKAVLVALFGSLTLGLAPFYPHAHVWKQLVNLAHGTLTEPIDVFDLILHGAPWVALLVVALRFAIDAAGHARAS
jgi:hypothetical protein